MRTIKRLAVGLLVTLTAALLAVGATGCTAKGDRENREHVCSWEITINQNATCTTNAKGYKKCACGEKESYEVPNTKLGHSYTVTKSDAVPATCTTNGKTAVLQCERCTSTTGGDLIRSPGDHDRNYNEKSKDYKGSKPANCQQGAYCGVCKSYEVDENGNRIGTKTYTIIDSTCIHNKNHPVIHCD